MTKWAFLLLLLGSTLASDTSGSIFDSMNTELSDAEYQEKLDNVEKTETLGESSETSSVDPALSANDAANGLISQLLEMGSTNTDLTAENEELEAEHELLEDQLADALVKANAYRIDKEMKSELLNNQIAALDNYNHELRAAELEAEQEVEEAKEGDDDDELDELEVSGTMIFVIGLGFLFLLLHGARTVVGYNIDNFLSPALYTLFVDISILLVICTITALAYYFELFDDDYLDYEIIIAGIAIFTFFWLVLGLWFIIAAQSFSTTWIRHEKACQDMRTLTQIFQDAQIDLEGSASRKMSAILRNFHYAIMRQLFICPTYLPPVTESYLRTDFDLSEYLSRSLADTLEKIFQLTWFGYILIVLGIVAWRIIVTGDDDAEFIALWAIPGVIILICLAILLKLRSVYYKLVPEPTDQIILNLPRDNFGRSPEMNEDIIPKPQYLRGHIFPRDREINYVNCCFVKSHPLKLTFSYIFSGSFPNRHELLYWFDKYGVAFVIGVLQAISVILTLWITVIILYYIPILENDWELVGILLICAAVIVYLFMACYLVPEAIRYLTLTSKIEMKKDRKIIEDVILHEKVEKAKMVVRVYRQFKMIYRERYEEAKGQLDDNIRKFSHEIFFLIADPDTRTVTISQLEDLLSLCGVRLNEDELRLFAKECSPDNLNEIRLSGFQKAISVLLASAVLKPQVVVKAVLVQYFKENKGEVVKDITLEELKQFFNDFGWHFTDEDIEDFLWEARFLLEDVGSASIVEIAGFMRNNVESFPK